MNISSITSLFKRKEKTLKLPESLLIKKLKDISVKNSLSIYENITIYHHTQSYFIPLLILDPSKGIYLFEYKEWSYEDLKNATISKATNQESTNKSLAFEKTHEFIKQKFNELTHNDGVNIYNFLLMPNLDSDEYRHLDESFQELLPCQRIMFNDSSDIEIFHKLKDLPNPLSPMPTESNIMGNLLVQYLILSKDKNIHLATDEQIAFIESKNSGLQTLSGNNYSGKTSTLLLKAILENLRDPELKIIIIEPTVLACDILKKRLLDIVEYAIIEVDVTQIEIITPIALINKHLIKLRKPILENALHVDSILMKKLFNPADLIICDDSNLLPVEFVEYLQHIQKKASLILVDEETQNPTFRFQDSFKTRKHKTIFERSNQFAKTLQVISKLLEHNSAKDILVVSNHLSKKNLRDDLEFFIEDDAIAIDANDNLENQNLEALRLCSYSQTSEMHSKFVILLDINDSKLNEIEYAINLAQDTSYIIYEENSPNIETLKEKYD